MDAQSQIFNRLIPAMMHSIDAEGRLVNVSQKWLDTLGYSEAEVLGRRSTEFMTEESCHYAREKILPAFFRSGRCSDIPYQMIAKSGQIIDVLLSATAEYDAAGHILHSLAVMQDVSELKQIERRLATSESALNDAQTLAQIGSWTFDYASHQLSWSAQVYELLNVPNGTAPSKTAFLSILHPEDVLDVREAYKRGLRSRLPYELRYRLLFPDGDLKYVRQHTDIQFNTDNQPTRLVSTLQDVTLQVLQELSIQESEDRFRTIADYTYDWEYWRGNNGEILYISPSCQRVTGYSQADFIRDPDLVEKIIHPAEQAAFKSHLSELVNKEESQLDFRIITKSGAERWIAHGCRAVCTSAGQPNGRRVSNRDITDLKIAEQIAQKLAYFDPLTGLPNRRMLVDRLNQSLSQAKRFERIMALMFIDLDRFKGINDTLGHDVGDELLIEVATRFSNCMRAGDTVARTGGDEFVVILPQINETADAVEVAGKLLKSLHQPILVLGHALEISASIGIALHAIGSNDNAAELMKNADLAMYEAKRAGRNGYFVFAG
jgi:diguanylate cyclase (GGDEF)-like protein/PAS domain S-box-containing protein